jgi:GH25 family lysozyme M1 (1,4-beta-N-acetylmuramidase)
VAGVAGKVDLNRFNGSAEELRGLLVQSNNR